MDEDIKIRSQASVSNVNLHLFFHDTNQLKSSIAFLMIDRSSAQHNYNRDCHTHNQAGVLQLWTHFNNYNKYRQKLYEQRHLETTTYPFSNNTIRLIRHNSKVIADKYFLQSLNMQKETSNGRASQFMRLTCLEI